MQIPMMKRGNLYHTTGDIDFHIVGGTVEPSNPVENILWINTGYDITEWSFDSTEPLDPVDGMIWLRIGKTAQSKFNILKEQSIYVYPIFCKQFVDGVWTKKEAQIYQNDAWTSISTNVLDFISGFTTQRENGSGSITVENETITATSTGTGSDNQGHVVYFSAEKIDVTDYDVLSFQIDFANKNVIYTNVGLYSANTSCYSWDNEVAVKNFSGSGSVAGMYNIDLSGVTGSYYFAVGMSGFYNWSSGTNTSIIQNIVLM